MRESRFFQACGMPLACLWKIGSGFRNTLFDKGVLSGYRSSLPVISVGNVSLGGNGKTPLTLCIAERLREEGYEPVILSRGYKGSLVGPVLVDSTKHSADEVGDEPLLLAKASGVSVVVSRRRAEGARYAEKAKLGNVLLLDDGLQHRWLKRDVDVLAVACDNNRSFRSWEKNAFFPIGNLRESPAQALCRVNTVVLVRRGGGKIDETSKNLWKDFFPADLPVYEGCFQTSGVFQLGSGTELAPQKIVAFAGIANPEPFFASLESLGFSIEKRFSFSDHYQFQLHDITRLQEQAGALPLVTTSKDSIRLAGAHCDTLFEARITFELEREEDFFNGIIQSIEEVCGRRRGERKGKKTTPASLDRTM